MSSGLAHTDLLTSNVIIPLETADTSIFAYVHESTKPLFELFGGKEIAKGMVEDVISRMFTRQG
jgi:nitrogenase molybdenum-iron protein alpha/beta subunit